MRKLYQCEHCKKIYKTEYAALICEKICEGWDPKIAVSSVLYGDKICDYCSNSFYVYGCELDCKYKKDCNRFNHYPNFICDEIKKENFIGENFLSDLREE